MESVGETAKKGGRGSTGVRNALLGSGLGSITFRGGYLGFFRVDVPEYGGVARGITKSDNRTEGSEEDVLDLAMCGNIEGP